jgi:hypothetical protein
VTGKRHAKARTQQDFNRKLRMQEEKSKQKEKLAKEKKLTASKQDFLNASYLHQQYTFHVVGQLSPKQCVNLIILRRMLLNTGI